MTRESLLNKTADELEAMTTEELEAYFAPVLHITRPERAAKPANVKKHSSGPTADDAIAAARAALKQAGFDGIL